MKHFLKNMKKYDIKYAMLMKLWLILDNYRMNFKKREINRLQDKVELILDGYDHHLQPPEPSEFVSNCINYWSCDCCPSKTLCNEY